MGERERRPPRPHSYLMENFPSIDAIDARNAIVRLAREHHLDFAAGPGGGEFYRTADGFRCQVTKHDEIADLQRLRKALKYDDGH